MSSKWAGIAVEREGVRTAAGNVDVTQLARYVYDRISAYTGANHEGVSTALIETALRTAPEPTAEPGASDYHATDSEGTRWTRRQAQLAAQAFGCVLVPEPSFNRMVRATAEPEGEFAGAAERDHRAAIADAREHITEDREVDAADLEWWVNEAEGLLNEVVQLRATRPPSEALREAFGDADSDRFRQVVRHAVNTQRLHADEPVLGAYAEDPVVEEIVDWLRDRWLARTDTTEAE